MMDVLKTVVINGQRYTLASLPPSARARLKEIAIVDQHIEALHQQHSLLQTARGDYLAAFKQAAQYQNPPTARCFWHIIASTSYDLLRTAATNTPMLPEIDGSHSYQTSDTIVLYVKGYGAVGCGHITYPANDTPTAFSATSLVSDLSHALSARYLKSTLGLSHPTRASMAVAAHGQAGLKRALESAARQ